MLDMIDMAEIAAALIHFTRHEKPIASIRVSAPVFGLRGTLPARRTTGP
jgi:hypothetical protein